MFATFAPAAAPHVFVRRLGLVLLVLLAAGCERAATAVRSYRGAELVPAMAKEPFTLTTTAGEPYVFAERTRGRLALLFFGYTHCPDVCPVHMTNIAAALEKLSVEDRARIDVIFVTTDPERDTPAQLRAWLDNFSPSFVGLIGERSEINRIEGLMHSATSVREPGVAGDTANYGVMHAAQIMAFTPDDSLRVLYPFGIRQEDWVDDLPKLLSYRSSVK